MAHPRECLLGAAGPAGRQPGRQRHAAASAASAACLAALLLRASLRASLHHCCVHHCVHHHCVCVVVQDTALREWSAGTADEMFLKQETKAFLAKSEVHSSTTSDRTATRSLTQQPRTAASKEHRRCHSG